MRETVLIDRDGVLNVHRPRSVLSVDDVALERGSAAALARLHRAGVTVAVCTNQSCIARGSLSPDELTRIHERIAAEVAAAGGAIAGFFVCPHDAHAACGCRKPAPGLLEQAHLAFGFEPRATWFVGDNVTDVDAAIAGRCLPALVRTGLGAESTLARPEVPVFADLEAFVDFYLARRGRCERSPAPGVRP